MLKFSDRQKAVHRQTLQEIAHMVASSRSQQSASAGAIPSQRDHAWAEQKVRRVTKL